MLYFGVAFQKLLNTGIFDLSVLLTIDFVSDQDEREFFWFFGRPLVQKLSDPRLDIIEGLNGFSNTRLLVMS